MAGNTSLTLPYRSASIHLVRTEASSTCRLASAKPWLPHAQHFTSEFFAKHYNFTYLMCSRKLRSSKQVHREIINCTIPSETVTPSLKDLPVFPYVNSDGRIRPPTQPGTKATIFAIYDNNMKVQYIGFSKDVRNSLRTLIGRRPELCHFYKLYNFTALDQKQLLDARQQWILELGSTPRGNSDVAQKNMWEKPVDSGSISERGKSSAAAAKAKMLLQTLIDKGLKEQMVYDPALLEQGKCDILPDKDTVEGKTEATPTSAQEDSRKKQVVVHAPSGDIVEYTISYEGKYKTNGGWMYDIAVNKDEKESRHRVICGAFYPEAASMPEDTFLERVIGFLLHKKVPRRTEGMRSGDQFPINYFAVGEVAQNFDDFKTWFSAPLPDDYWRFNRIHTYGTQLDPPPPVGPEDLVSTVAKKIM